jgi:hypothetical protein
VSRDDGASWQNVTPPDLPEWIQINSIDPHPFEPGGLYVAATMYKHDDLRPYLYRTTDFGRTWSKITDGIPADQFTRVVRADPVRRGLLYAGTEAGVFVSFDDGAHWQTLQRDLPRVPVTDLTVKDGDLVAATQGRSFWVLDDLSLLREVRSEIAAAALHLFAPRPAWRVDGGGGGGPTRGANPPAGAVLHFWLKEVPKEGVVTLDILDASGARVRSFASDGKDDEGKLLVKAGMNRFVWDLRHPAASKVPGMILWGGEMAGPRALPGTCEVRLCAGENSARAACEIRADPRGTASMEDLRAQLAFLLRVRDKISEVHQAILDLRRVRAEVEALVARSRDHPAATDLRAMAEALRARLTAIEEALYQTKSESAQDPLNFPIRLNDKLGCLANAVAAGDFAPTRQAEEVWGELAGQVDLRLAALHALFADDVAAFNARVQEAGVPAVVVPPRGK